MPRKLLVICENSNSLTEGYISIQAQAMRSLGWDVYFLCCEGRGGSGNADYHQEGFRIEHVACSRLIKPVTILARVKRFIRTYYYSNSELTGKEEIACWRSKTEDISPDIILVQFGTMAAKLLPVLESFPAPWLVHFHGFDVTERCGYWGYRRTLRHLLKVAPAVVGCSNFVVGRLQKYVPKENAYIHAVSPGYDEARYCYQRRERPLVTEQLTKFVSVARLAEGKGHDITLRAMARLKMSCWTLTIIGDGPERSRLDDLSRELGVEPRVNFLGAQTPGQILQKFKESDVFIQSSRCADSGWIEGLGLSSLEAAATGLPVIVSDSGGLGETCVQNETGFIYAEGNLDELELALNKLCHDYKLRKKMGDAGASWVRKKYSSEVQGQKLNGIMMEMTGR